MIPNKRKNFEDITGELFGELLVTTYVGRKYTPSGSFKSEWSCRCSCGTDVLATTPKLKSGAKTSCGCKTKLKISNTSRKHGLHSTPEYVIWNGLRARCNNPYNKDWPNYGGRGIEVCRRWDTSVENFISDMGFRPSSGHSIDRIDVNGDYEPSNCRWATILEQNNNRRNTRKLTAFGITKSIKDWANEFNINVATIRGRIDKFNWSNELAISTPSRKWVTAK